MRFGRGIFPRVMARATHIRKTPQAMFCAVCFEEKPLERREPRADNPTNFSMRPC